MTFDAREAKLLQPGQHITSPEYPGLRLEAFSDRRTWTYRYRSPIDSKLRQVKIGSWPAKSVHAAIVEWEALRRLREAGRDPALEAKGEREKERQAIVVKKAKAARLTVRVACDSYLNGHVIPSRKKKGADEVGRLFDRHLGDLGMSAVEDVTRAQAFELIKNLSLVSPVIAQQLRAELGATWDYCIDAGLVPETTPNWWRLILRGKIKSKGKKINGKNIGTAKRFLSPREAGTLIRWLPNFTQLIEDALTLYLWTCTRGVELLSMEGKEVNQEDDGLWWWVIPKEKTKNARHEEAADLRVPLFGRAQAVVLRRRERYGEGALFPAKRRDGTIGFVEQKTVQATTFYHQPYCMTRPDKERPRLTVTHWAPHDLRRTSRTFLAAMGCPDAVGESIIGHMIPGVRGIYNKHAYDAERVEWLKKLSDYLESLAAV